MDSHTLDVSGLTDLGRVLWRLRDLLDDLQFRLEAHNLLLLAGRDRWVHRVADEVQVTLDAISVTEVERGGLVALLAPSLGLRPDVTLRDLASVAPDPWGVVLSDHHASLLEVVHHISDLSQRAGCLLHGGIEATRDMVSKLTGVIVVRADGCAEPGRTEEADLDTALVELRSSQSSLEASLDVMTTVDPASLLDFLR